MKVSNYVARMLCSEMEVGDVTTEWEDRESEGYPHVEMIHNEMIDTSRWSHIYEVVYKDLDTGKYWENSYRVGATECQDERPYEYDGDEITFYEVEPYTVTTTKYRCV